MTALQKGLRAIKLPLKALRPAFKPLFSLPTVSWPNRLPFRDRIRGFYRQVYPSGHGPSRGGGSLGFLVCVLTPRGASTAARLTRKFPQRLSRQRGQAFPLRTHGIARGVESDRYMRYSRGACHGSSARSTERTQHSRLSSQRWAAVVLPSPPGRSIVLETGGVGREGKGGESCCVILPNDRPQHFFKPV